MKKRLVFVLSLCFIVISIYVYAQDNSNLNKTNLKDDDNTILLKADNDHISKMKEDLLAEVMKERESLIKENTELRDELKTFKKQFNYTELNDKAKFYNYTVVYTLNNIYHSVFNENTWKDGTNFKVDGKTYLNGIGFDRLDNKDGTVYYAKLYNEDGKYTKLTGKIGIDDLSQNLKNDDIVTFKVYNNDVITKCYNEFFGDVLYSTEFKKSDKLQEIDVNLKEANNIIIEFSVDKESDLNYFLLLDPKLK